MSLRRFLNLVLQNYKDGIYSQRRIDLSRQHLFYPTPPPPEASAVHHKKLDLQEMESIRIPAASARFQPNPSYDSIDHVWKVHCFGLSESKIICTDNSGLAFLYDAVSRSFVTMPSLHTPKWCPISFSVTGSEQDGVSSLYIMEKVPSSDPEEGQFEAFIYTTSQTSYNKSWYRHSLPLPPYILDPCYKRARIQSHAVLGGGSHLCISAIGHGTYCFDTASREWSHAGDWMLPMCGKAEYVPELDIWFGLSDGDLQPCVCDLSSVLRGQKPELHNIWRNHYPPDWNSLGITKIVSLGSGRFCFVNFFETMEQGVYGFGGEPVVDLNFAVFTGVQLLPSRAVGDKLLLNENGTGNTVNGKGARKIRMVNHMSKLHVLTGSTTIEEVL
ncbi:unnamed protein product [Urochloa humidicola]